MVSKHIKREQPRVSHIMKNLKSAHFPTLLELLSLGATRRPIPISSINIAKRIGKSQQLISKHLLDLEANQVIERSRDRHDHTVMITPTGEHLLRDIYNTLKIEFEAVTVFELKGEYFSGMGEGSYYMSLDGYRKQFISKLGIDPFPGTFNVRLTSPTDRKLYRELRNYPGVRIEGFRDEKRTFGGANCFSAVIGDRIDAFVLSIDRTHYDDSVLEILSSVEIRTRLKLKQGDDVTINVLISKENNSDPSGSKN